MNTQQARKTMRLSLVRAKNNDLLAMIKAGDNILAQCNMNYQVVDMVVAAARELQRRGRDPETGKRLTVKPKPVK
tara:strand:- start:1696 stop:1920 length:225 start_codon:yes stop_codon:yes gene_type:complete